MCGCEPARISEENLSHVKIGMNRQEVESILGPGVKIEGVPSTPDFDKPIDSPERIRPVVTGDEFLEWQGPVNGQKIIVGFRKGKVCDKWYWEVSL